jgi:hypothetical protein
LAEKKKYFEQKNSVDKEKKKNLFFLLKMDYEGKTNLGALNAVPQCKNVICNVDGRTVDPNQTVIMKDFQRYSTSAKTITSVSTTLSNNNCITGNPGQYVA